MVSPIDAALLLLRLTLGLSMVARGCQMTLGWFGGDGFTGIKATVGRIGVRPRTLWAVATAGGNLLGGLGITFGLLTPLAAALAMALTFVIIFAMHWSRGYWNRNGGIEFPLLLFVVAAAIGLAGPGALSLDAVLSLQFVNTLPVFLASAAIAVGSAWVSLLTRQNVGEAPAPAHGPPSGRHT